MAVQFTRRIEQTVGIVVLSLLAIGCFVVLRPFIPAILWAMILVLATWPAYRWLHELLRGRRTLAATLMTVLLALALLLPLVAVGTTLADDVVALTEKIRKLIEEGPPPPPAWLEQIPLIGGMLHAYWQEFARGGASVAAELKPYIGPIKDWLLAAGSNVGRALFDLSLSVFTAFFIYRDGPGAARRLGAVVERVAGDRAQRLLGVAESTVKGVVYGIIGTAIAQGFLAGIGLGLAGVPGALLLGIATAVFSIVPFGPPLIWGTASAWLLYQGNLGGGLFLLAWGALVVSSVDNVLKPLFISRSSKLPLILVFLGVFGGVIAFGFLGIFIGPTLLAVSYTLLKEWTEKEAAPALAEDDGPRAPPA